MTFEQAFSFEELYKCHKLCRRNKQHKNETIKFELNINQNLTKLSKLVINQNYEPKKYRSFYVYEPKKRIIDSLPYSHRLIQRSLCDNILIPSLEKLLIYDNAACRKNKGTHFALYRLSKFLRIAYKMYGSNLYFLQCDISKYFQSIWHKKLKEYVHEVKFDEKSEDLIFKYIDSYSFSNENNEQFGIPIGNQTSQWFALLYLDKLDKYIKQELKIKFYIRYMDDFILIHQDKKYLNYCFKQIENFVSKIQLKLNHKSQINKTSRGIPFLGFRTVLLENGKVLRLLRATTKTRLKNNYKKLNFLFNRGVVDEEYLIDRFRAYKNHLFYANCHKWFYYVSKKMS